MNESVPAQADEVPITPSVAMLRTLGLVAALSGFLVVLAYQITLPMIEENKRLAIERALFKVVPAAVQRRDFLATGTEVVPHDPEAGLEGVRIYAGYDSDGKLAGLALEAAAQGYQDVIRILYGYDPRCSCIRGIEVLKMAETPGIGDKIAKDEAFLKNFEALDARLNAAGDALENPIVAVKSGTKSEDWHIDSISGATISSKAVARMLNDSAHAVLPAIHAYLDLLERAPVRIPGENPGGNNERL